MKLFKNLTVSTLCLWSAFSFAQDINIIVNGKPGGTFYDRSNLYAEELGKAGYKVNLINIPKNTAAAEHFNSTKEPSLMVWIDALAPVRPLEATQENFVANEYSAPLFLCAITGKIGGTIGAPKMYVMEPVLEMIPGGKIIPYKNTGATLNASLAGEVDFAYLNQGKAQQLVDAGYPCKAVQGVAQNALVVGTNIDLDTLRTAVVAAQQSVAFAEWINKNNFSASVHSSREQELADIDASEELWKAAAK